MRAYHVALLAGLALTSVSSAQAMTLCQLHPTAPQCLTGGGGPPVVVFPGDPPVVSDPCISDPASCEDHFDHHVAGTGVAVVRQGGAAVKLDATVDLLFNDAAFQMTPKQGVVLTGRVLPKGTLGNKLQLFLDDASVGPFRSYLAELSESAGNSPVTPVGDSTKMVLTIDEGAIGTLKIKAQLLGSDGSETLFKIKTAGEHEVKAH